MDLLNVIFRTIFFYFFIILSYRIMGKREIGQLSVVDLIISILIAELVAISIENKNETVLFTVLPICILVVLEVSLAYINMKSRKFRSILDGKPSLIIYNGKVNYKEMVKQRYSLDDLLLSLRQKEIKSIEDVEYAFLEPNGKLSIFKYNIFKLKSSYPMPIIVDGTIEEKALKYILKNKNWLLKELKKHNLELNNIFYAFYKNKKLYIINKK